MKLKRFLFGALTASVLAFTIPAQVPSGAGFPGAGGLPLAPAIDPTTGLPIQAKVDTGPRFNLNFPGGSPSELIDAIEKISHQRPNVVIHPECKDFTIPDFRLRDVSAYQVFMTLNTLLNQNGAGFWQRVPLEDGEVWTLLPQGRSGGQPFGGGFVPPQSQPRPQPNCKVFNLAPFLDKYTVEDITTAVQGAWDLMKLENAPTIKFHKDTKLLIVVGYVNELNVVADVLRQLEQNLDPKEKVAKGAAPDSNKESKPASKF